MNNAIAYFKGKKTYICGALALAVVAAWMAGMIDNDTATKALDALGFGVAITLRAAIAKGA